MDVENELTGDERAELARLRAENEFLRVQRDILVNVASGFAQDFEAIQRRANRCCHH